VSLTWRCISCGGTYNDTLPDGLIYMHVCPPQIRDDSGRLISNRSPRNENVASNRPNFVTGIVSEGEGTKCTTDTILKEPAWITALRSRIPKREETDNV
jgi:hypothetical protein